MKDFRFQKGDNFTLVIPGYEGLRIFLKYNDNYQIIEDPENYQLTSELDHSLNEIIPSLVQSENVDKSLFLTKAEIIPHFMYRLSLGENQEKYEKVQSQLSYPPLPTYHRDENKIVITAREVHFIKPCQLKFSSDSFNTTIDLDALQDKKTGNDREITYSKNLSEDSLQNFFSQEKYLLQLKQDNFSFTLEHKIELANSEEEKSISSLVNLPWLSLKDLLDAEDGFQRLINDVTSGSYQSKNRKKLEKLLDIIRVARFSEEEKIMKALIVNDFAFYQEIQNTLFSIQLLPYMNRNEVSQILRCANDEILQQIANLTDLEQNLFRRFFSKNRFEDICLGKKETSAPKPIWSFIEAHFRKTKERRFSFQAEKIQFLEERANATTKIFQAIDNKLGGFLNSNPRLFTLSFSEQRLEIMITEAIKKLTIFSEVRPALFYRHQFEYLPAGKMIINTFVRMPRRIVMAAITQKNTLLENICCRF